MRVYCDFAQNLNAVQISHCSWLQGANTAQRPVKLTQPVRQAGHSHQVVTPNKWNIFEWTYRLLRQRSPGLRLARRRYYWIRMWCHHLDTNLKRWMLYSYLQQLSMCVVSEDKPKGNIIKCVKFIMSYDFIFGRMYKEVGRCCSL